MTLFLVRHGRTDANASGLLLGRLDPPLDVEGERQAELVADAFEREVPDCTRVITSPLLRTRATAELIASRLGSAVEVDERWIELDYGDFDGLPFSEVPAATWQEWKSDPSFVTPGGESLVDLGRRVQVAAAELVTEGAAGNVVVVSHVSPIKAAVAWALGVGDQVAWRMYLAPASITRIGCGGREPSLSGFNDVSHLGQSLG